MTQDSSNTNTREKEGGPEKKGTGFHVALEYFRTIVITLAAAMMLKVFVLEAYRIPSGSMEDTLMIGDFLLVNKLAYGLRTPHRFPMTNIEIPSLAIHPFGRVEHGDIVVFEYPYSPEYPEPEEQVNYIKRCIGLPGDTVALRSGRVFVNGREMSLPHRAKVSGSATLAWNTGARLVPDGRGYTEDDYGPIVVPKEGDRLSLNGETIDDWRPLIELEGHNITLRGDGSVLVDGERKSDYVVEDDYYFMLGDNRHNSLDSRFWGFVPDKKLIGEALMVYWSWDPDISVSNVGEKIGSVRWNRLGTLVR